MNKWLTGLRAKLLMIGVMPIIALTIIAYIGVMGIDQLNNALHVAYQERVVLTEEVGEVDARVNSSMRWLLNAILFENNFEKRKSVIEKARVDMAKVDTNLANYMSLTRSEEAKKIVNEEFSPNWNDAKIAMEDAFKEMEKNTPAGNTLAKKILDERIRPKTFPLAGVLLKLADIRKTRNLSNMNTAFENSAKEQKIMVILSVVAIIFSIILSVILISRLITALINVTSSLDKASDEVTAAAAQIAEAAEELSQATTEQASSLEETVAAIEEMNSMVRRNTESASNASQSSLQSKDVAEKGQAAVQIMMHSIEDVRESNEKIMNQINESNNQFTEIISIINNISDKTKVINDIVFQTKLLSFNASVEAARAGELGKGFAVVADEVGKLAQMSGSAAKEISDLLNQSIEKVHTTIDGSKEKITKLANEGIKKVDHSVNTSSECRGIFTHIVSSVQNVSTLSADISHANSEQSQGIQEINKAMIQLDQMTQQNAANSQQSAHAATSLANQAVVLKNEVEHLLILIDGKSAQQSTSYQSLKKRSA